MSLPSSPTDCGTPDSTNSNGCDSEPLNILHTHSINSIHSLLLDQAYMSDNEMISSTSSNNKAKGQGHGHGHGNGNPQVNETISITDLLGLNSPRGTLLGNSFNNTTDGYFSNSPRNYHQDNKQTHRDEFNYGLAINNPGKHGNRNSETITACTPPSPSSFINSRIGRNSSVSFNDVSSTAGSNNNNNNSNMDSSFFLSNSSSRSNSPADSDTSLMSNMDNINELMSSLALNINNQIPTSTLNTAALNAALNSNNPLTAAATANFLNGVTELELTNLQNLQAIHALKYLQQPPVVLGSLLQYSPACSRNNQWNGTAASILSNLNQQTSDTSQNIALDRAARFHRNSASLYDATCTWSGVLPQRTQKPTGYSSKVFLGGVPWDISEQLLVQTFKQFGPIKVEWPGKEKQACQPKGYVYIIFESEKQVRSLLQSCTHDYVNGGSWFFKISSKRMKSKEAQVIPWIINDSNFVKSTSHKLDPSKTVFVGALHGMLTAEGLAKIMNDLFEGVIYAGIDTDKYKYPIGSGRVTFNNNRSYMKAVTAAFIDIKTTKFTKKVQVDPYLEDSLCSFCAVQQGPYFCRELLCFRYFCRPCWQLQHTQDAFRTHKPLMRNSKTATIVGLNVEQQQQQQQQHHHNHNHHHNNHHHYHNNHHHQLQQQQQQHQHQHHAQQSYLSSSNNHNINNNSIINN